MSEELLPCPFCGTDNPKAHHIRDGQSLSCRGCGASVHSFNPYALEKNWAKWNLRTPTQFSSDNLRAITDKEAGQ